jgi:hypothetical protein
MRELDESELRTLLASAGSRVQTSRDLVGAAIAADRRHRRTRMAIGGASAAAGLAVAGGLAVTAGGVMGSNAPAGGHSNSGVGSSAPKPSDTPATANGITPPTSVAPRPSGIIDIREGPFATSVFQVNNAWAGATGGRWLIVYAGGPKDPSDARLIVGGVYLIAYPLDPLATDQSPTDLGEVRAPVGTGALTITSANGTVLTLTNAQGHLLHFDIASRRFVP